MKSRPRAAAAALQRQAAIYRAKRKRRSGRRRPRFTPETDGLLPWSAVAEIYFQKTGERITRGRASQIARAALRKIARAFREEGGAIR